MDGEGASSGGIDGRIMATIALGSRELSASVDLTDRVHLLPCVIKHDGAGPVSQYFKPRKSDMVADGLTVEESYFRGRKLQGVTVPIPNGYRGYVLEKKKIKEGRRSEVVEGEANSWASRAEFQNITYWNHDSLPSKHDPLVRSFHWFAISDAISASRSEEPVEFWELDCRQPLHLEGWKSNIKNSATHFSIYKYDKFSYVYSQELLVILIVFYLKYFSTTV